MAAERATDALCAHRVLAVLECRPSDDVVRARAVQIAASAGGYLTLVVVAPRPFPYLFAGSYCAPRASAEELRMCAAATLRRATALVPAEIPLIAELDEGKPADVIRRRVELAAHDLVVARACRGLAHVCDVPVIAC